MSEKLPNMLDRTIEKIKEMVDANSVVGQPIVIGEDTTIIPISNVSVGFAGGGSDFTTKRSGSEMPFGGGVGGGVKVIPVAFLVLKEGSVRVIPVATPANTPAERLVEMIPDTIDKITNFVDNRLNKKGE